MGGYIGSRRGHSRPDAGPEILCRRSIRERLCPRDHVAQIRERGVAVPAGRQVRFERGALGGVELAVDVLRQPIGPEIVHRSKCLRSAIRA